MEEYDLIVIGSGAGMNVASNAVQAGKSVAVAEHGLMGGTCLNTGCIATKAMLHASELRWNVNCASAFGISAGRAELDGSVFTERVRKVVGGLRRGVESLLKVRQVDVVRGRGRLVDIPA